MRGPQEALMWPPQRCLLVAGGGASGAEDAPLTPSLLMFHMCWIELILKWTLVPGIDRAEVDIITVMFTL